MYRTRKEQGAEQGGGRRKALRAGRQDISEDRGQEDGQKSRTGGQNISEHGEGAEEECVNGRGQETLHFEGHEAW